MLRNAHPILLLLSIDFKRVLSIDFIENLLNLFNISADFVKLSIDLMTNIQETPRSPNLLTDAIGLRFQIYTNQPFLLYVSRHYNPKPLRRRNPSH